MLHSLTVRNFRCIEYAELAFQPGLNLVAGANASGKTTLLEAIFFLGRARSFRTNRLEPLIRHQADELQVYGRVGEAASPLGIRRGRRHSEMRYAGQPVTSLAALAQAFPVQVLDPTVHGLLEEGPKQRRRFLDWGVFHVEQGFQSVWQRYNRALRQRNVLLRQEAAPEDFPPWEQELAETGSAIDRYRRAYLERLVPALLPVTTRLLALEAPIQLEYLPGWPEAEPLEAALARSREQDRSQGATRPGPHRADFTIKINNIRAQDMVSRGQQKVLAGALVLTQSRLYRERTGESAVLLADDLPAELDGAHLERFLELAGDGSSQLFLTAIRPDAVPESMRRDAAWFHVEQGAFRTAELV